MTVVVEAREPSAKYLSALQPPLVRHFELIATAPGEVARLRELILTLAVQGKLVAQNPSDEPASALLKSIQAEKERLISEGKIKRGKPLVDILEEEQPFLLPRGWEWVRLNSLLQKIGAGSTPLGGREVYVPSGVKFLRSQNVWNDGLRLDSVAFIKPATHTKMSGTVVLANDLLFNITGASIGRCALVPSDFDEANVSQHVTIVRTMMPELNEFLHKILVSRHVQQTVMDVQVGVSREGLSIAKLGQFLIPLPPLAEQSRIVTRVEELMRLCDALEAQGQLETAQHAQLVQTLLGALTASATSDELADNWQRVATHFGVLLDRPEAIDALEQTILQLAVRGLLVPQDPNDEPASELLKKIRAEKDRLIAEGKIRRDKPLPPIAEDEKPFELPVGWERAPLQHIGYTQTGTTPDKKNPDFYGAHIPFIKPGDIHPGYVDYGNEGLSERGLKDSGRTAPAGSILMVCIGTIGKTNIISRDCSFNQQINSLTPLCCVSEFISLYLRCPGFQSQAWARSSSTTISILNKGKWEEIPLALPPLAEQSRIVTRVESLFRLCADLRQRLAARQTTQAHLAEALIAEVA